MMTHKIKTNTCTVFSYTESTAPTYVSALTSHHQGGPKFTRNTHPLIHLITSLISHISVFKHMKSVRVSAYLCYMYIYIYTKG